VFSHGLQDFRTTRFRPEVAGILREALGVNKATEGRPCSCFSRQSLLLCPAHSIIRQETAEEPENLKMVE
jgi:hypothetical protein